MRLCRRSEELHQLSIAASDIAPWGDGQVWMLIVDVMLMFPLWDQTASIGGGYEAPSLFIILDVAVPRASQEGQGYTRRVLCGEGEVEDEDGEEDREDLLHVRRDSHCERSCFLIGGETDDVQAECYHPVDE